MKCQSLSLSVCVSISLSPSTSGKKAASLYGPRPDQVDPDAEMPSAPVHMMPVAENEENVRYGHWFIPMLQRVQLITWLWYLLELDDFPTADLWLNVKSETSIFVTMSRE